MLGRTSVVAGAPFLENLAAVRGSTIAGGSDARRGHGFVDGRIGRRPVAADRYADPGETGYPRNADENSRSASPLALLELGPHQECAPGRTCCRAQGADRHHFFAYAARVMRSVI
ncbi:MAG: hypothetical protein ABI831_16490, partial [Betaproteobacteria bacterium]